MKHLGDIAKINWFEVEPVDVVTGGSPCQDLSVAGKRAGLAGERSCLYMEQIRCIKELRQADEQRGRTGAVRPRYMVWENVPGAFSSNGGRDFAAVIEEAVRVVEPQAPAVPVPEKGWPAAGCLYDDMGRWSVAWRVHDAQHWGAPQRRKRIALVCDFAGRSAPEVLFERKGLSGYSDPGGTAREEATGTTGGGAYPAIARSLTARHDGSPCADRGLDVVLCLQGNMVDRDTGMNGSGVSSELMFSLNTVDRHAVCAGFSFGQSEKARSIGYQENISPTLRGGEGGNQKPCVFDARGNGNGETVPTLTGDHQNRITDYTAICVGNGQINQISMAEQANTLDARHDQQCVMVAHSLKAKANCDFREDSETYPITHGTVRRLTPLECERLQGYPDGWTDIGEWTDSKGKKHKEADSPRYKALGNSIALPFWFWLLRRISAQYSRPATLGSLFDGIGGFPLCWERCNGQGTARWASEIEEFPMAVTKLRFGEE